MKRELDLAAVTRKLELAAVTRELDLAAVEREVDQTSPALRKREPLIVEAAERQLKLLLRMRFSFEHSKVLRTWVREHLLKGSLDSMVRFRRF